MHTGNVLVPVGVRFRRIPSTVLGQPTIFRATEQISLIRGGATGPREIRTRTSRYTRGRSTEGGCACNPRRLHPPFGHFLFIVLCYVRLIHAFAGHAVAAVVVESSVNQRTRANRSIRQTLSSRFGFILRKDSPRQLGWKNFRILDMSCSF